jgi:hypothetical protein
MSTDLRIAGAFERGEPISIIVNGARVKAYRGESVAAGGARGAFCHMGVCQECTVEHAGRAVSSCQLACVDGMTIELRTLTDGAH